jgi:catechol 2,3-dioxygenase-like lactoylglutathione lyase family enzyme
MNSLSRAAIAAFALVTITAGATAQTPAPHAGLRTLALVVRDMDETLAFYRDILGYRVNVERMVTNRTSIETVGLDPYQRFRLIYLKPNAEFASHPFSMSDLSLVQPLDGPPIARRTDPCAGRETSVGQMIMSKQVEGLQAILAQAEKAGYCIVSSLRDSATGQSLTAAVLDPNGVRIELFEYK